MRPNDDAPVVEAEVADTETRKPWLTPSVQIHDVGELTEALNFANPDSGAGSS